MKERLASYKAPRYYAFVDKLPRNYLGKVLKTELRKEYGEARDGEPRCATRTPCCGGLQASTDKRCCGGLQASK